MIIAVVAVIIIAAAAYFLFFRPGPEPSPEPNKAPIVVSGSSQTFATVGDTVTFTAEGSRDPDGSIASYSWNLGDETTETGEEVEHAYDIPGDYVVTLTATDDEGESSTNDVVPLFVKVDREPIEVTIDSPPIAVLGTSKQVANIGDEITFDGASSYGWRLRRGEIQSTTGTVVAWEWDFGDGATSDEESTTNSYDESGNYLVTLTVTDEGGKTDTVARTIRVLPEGGTYTGTIKNPDTYIWVERIPTTIDFRQISGGYGRQYITTLSDFLVWTGPGDVEAQTEGSLSERWEISEDGMSYTFYLREGVKFWNGDELTAEDVEYTWERYMALEVAEGSWGMLFERLMGIRPGNPVPDEAIKDAVEVIDDYTVRFNLAERYAPFLITMAYPYTGIIQKDYAIENGAWSWDSTVDYEELAGHDPPMDDGVALMATGPFKILEWSKGERFVFERFDDYWKGPAELEFVRVIDVPEWSTRSLMLQLGDVDGITCPSSVEFEQLVGEPGIETILVKYRGYVELIYFGLDPQLVPPEHQVESDFFDDVNMRKAFAYAFPYEKYIEEVWLGYAEAAKGVLPPGWLGAYENYPYYYDLEKAEEHLKLAHDGKYYEEGFQIAAGTQLWAMATHGRAYEMISEEFAKIDPKYKIVPIGAQWSDMLQMPLGMLIGVIGLDPLWYRNIYHSQFSFESSYGWGNDRVDELIIQSVETPFIEERLPLLEEAMDIVAEEAPAILTVFNPHLVALRDYVSGYWYQVNHVSAGGYFYDISKGG
jgi:peptide/nickel transport system substrate-binding protein